MIRLAICLLLFGTPAVAQQSEADPLEQSVDQAVQLARNGRLDEAIQLLEGQREATGLPDGAQGILGTIYLAAGQPDAAYRVLQPLALEESASHLVLTSAGRAAFAIGQVDEAEAWMRRAVALAPESDTAQQFGIYLGGEGRFEEAIQILRPFVAAHPEDHGTALALAMAALKIGAMEDASRALERLPVDGPAANMLRSELALQRGEPYRARELLESAWESRPPGLDLDFRRLLGEVYVTTGEAQRAVEILRGFESTQPGLALLLSRALYQTGDAQAAADVLEPHVQTLWAIDESSSEAQIVLAVGIATESGRALVALERASEAEDALRLAARLLPSDAETWNVLAHALIALGKTKAAREAAARYHDLSQTPLVEN